MSILFKLHSNIVYFSIDLLSRLHSAEPPSKFTEFTFFHDCTVVTTSVTLTDNGEAKRGALTNH